MTTMGIAMVRDEADVIEAVVLHMLGQVDRVIVADNGSVDGTRDILESLPVTVVDDPEIGYYQSRKMTRLAHLAAEQGATWVVPFDADEVWYSRFHARITDLLEALAPQWLTAAADLYDHVATDADDPSDPNPITRIQWRRVHKVPLPKVACRVRADLVIEQGNHGAFYQGGTTSLNGDLVIRHFPYRSPEQFIRKAVNGAAAYAATDLGTDVGAHWRQYGQLIAAGGDEVGAGIFREWFHVERPYEVAGLILDPAPYRRWREE